MNTWHRAHGRSFTHPPKAILSSPRSREQPVMGVGVDPSSLRAPHGWAVCSNTCLVCELRASCSIPSNLSFHFCKMGTTQLSPTSRGPGTAPWHQDGNRTGVPPRRCSFPPREVASRAGPTDSDQRKSPVLLFSDFPTPTAPGLRAPPSRSAQMSSLTPPGWAPAPPVCTHHPTPVPGQTPR